MNFSFLRVDGKIAACPTSITPGENKKPVNDSWVLQFIGIPSVQLLALTFHPQA